MGNNIARFVMSMDVANYLQLIITDKSSELFHTTLKNDCAEIIGQFAQQCLADIFIDSLALDLGEIPLQDFEHQLRQRFQQQFRQQLLMYHEDTRFNSTRWSEEHSLTEGQHQKINSEGDWLNPTLWPEVQGLTGDEQPKIHRERLSRQEQLALACLHPQKRRRLLAFLNKKRVDEIGTLLDGEMPLTLQRVLLLGLRYFQQYSHASLPPPREEALMVIIPEQDDDLLKTLFFSRPSPGLLPWLSALWQQPAVRLALENRINADVADLLQKNVPEQKTEPVSKQALTSKIRSKVMQPQEVIPSQPLPVCNAGLVALWPLLPDLFQRLGLWEKGAFTLQNARQQATSCLDWLIWQDEPAQEGQMILTQWLCGLALDEECQREVVSTQHKSVLEAWLAQLSLQLTGWRTLEAVDVRALFLQRSGKLVLQKNRLLLQVDPQPFDILLDEWPWPLTNLMLPWLPAAIAIDWPQPGFERAEAHYA